MTAPAAIEKGGMALLVELETNGALSATGLHLSKPDLSYGEFEAIGFLLGRMHQSLRFAIGDWLLLGEQLFPVRWSQAAEALGLSEEGMKEYLRVSERVPRSTRREGVSWSHHRAVAALSKVNSKGETVPDYKAQREWLKKVADTGMSHHALRDALRGGEAVAPSTSLASRECKCCGRAYEET